MDSERQRSLRALALFTIVFASLLLLILVPSHPRFSPSGRDSGVFLYIGSRLLEGEIPYKDIWDHKGPVIYFINALGLVIGSGSSWGVWSLQYVSLTGAAVFGFIALRHQFDTTSALVASVLWIVTLPVVFQQGNLTETWALAFQFGALLLFVLLSGASKVRDTRRLVLLAFGIGVLGGLAFSLRPNLISIWVAMSAVWLIRSARPDRKMLHLRLGLAAVTGGLIVVLTFVGFFWANDALWDLWNSAFVYNWNYTIANASFLRRVWSTINLLQIVSSSGSGIMIIGGLGLLMGFAMMLLGVLRQASIMKIPTIIQIAIIALPLEILVSGSLAGRNFAHYAQAWLPSLAILSAFAVHLALRNLTFRSYRHGLMSLQTGVVSLIIVAIISVPALIMLKNINVVRSYPGERIVHQTEVVQYLQSITDPNDSILVWGAETNIYFLTDRHAPTRFVYQYAQFAPGFSSEQLYSEFIDDVQEAKPKVIVDASFNTERIPPLNRSRVIASECGNTCTFENSLQFVSLLDFIEQEYQLIETIGTGRRQRDIYRALCC